MRKDIGPGEAGRLQGQRGRPFQGFRSRVDGYFIERARVAGLRVLGRTSTPEFGSSAFTHSLICGITRKCMFPGLGVAVRGAQVRSPHVGLFRADERAFAAGLDAYGPDARARRVSNLG